MAEQLSPLSLPDLPTPRYEDPESGLGSAAETAIELAQNIRLRNASSALALDLDNDTNNWFEQQREAQAAPNVADVFNVDQEEIDAAPEPVQAIMKEVARQRLAADQGAISATELKVRHEATLRRYMNQYPQLAPELQQAAGQTIGYNPLGAHIDAMMEQLEGTEASNAAQQWTDLDNYANAVGVNMTLREVNPVEYFTQVMGFAQRDTEYEYLKRELDITKVQKESRNILENEQFRKTVGANVMGRAAGMMQKITRMVSAVGFDKAEFAANVLPGIRNEIAAFNMGTRQRIMRDFPELSQEQIDSFMKPIEDNLTLVSKSASIEEMQGALNLFKTQATAQVYAEFPELVKYETAASILGNLPSIEGLLAKKQLAGAYSNLIFNLVGDATVHGGAGLGLDPTTLTPQDRNDVYKSFTGGLSAILPKVEQNPDQYAPVAKRMTMQMFNFLDQENAVGTGGSKEANEEFLRLWSDPASADIIRKGGVTVEDQAALSKGVQFAVNMIYHQTQQDRAYFDKFRDTRVPGNLLNMTPGGGATTPVTMNDLLEMSMSGDGTVTLSANWANVGMNPSKVPASIQSGVDRMVAEAQLRFGTRLTEAVRMIAHMQGSTNYPAALAAYETEMKQPVLDALLIAPRG